MNTFGSSLLQFALCDVRSIQENRTRFRREHIKELERVNHFYCPVGRHAFKGWVLLPRYEYVQLDPYSTALQLNIGNTTQLNNVGTLKSLAIVQARCVTRGLASDINAMYLIELTDARGIIHNEWFQFPTVSMYNIRSPAYPQTFHPASMNNGTTWTWSAMLQNLWEQMPLLGTWPTLPVFPSGTPEGFWFSGVSAWKVLNDVLDHLGLTIACDLTKASPFTIVSQGADDIAFDTLQAKYVTNLEDDLDWLDVGAGRVPKTIIVLFRRRNSTYGTEETVRYDSPYQWDMSSIYQVSVVAPLLFHSATGTHHIWSDFTVRYDVDGNPVADDVTTATAIAQERVTQYFDSIYSRTSGYMSQTYAGALPFTTGSQVDSVMWFMKGDDQSGWRTKIIRGDDTLFARFCD